MERTVPGEKELQSRMETSDRAELFYKRQMRDSLTERMMELIGRQEMMFVATSDAEGKCDCTPRFGNGGFALTVNDRTLMWPEFRGNGVYASLGNIIENPHVGLVFVDFFDTTVGLHVNGRAESYTEAELPAAVRQFLEETNPQTVTDVERWVVVDVDEAYIHCSKHVPKLQKQDKPIDWGTDDPVAKSDSYFLPSAPAPKFLSRENHAAEQTESCDQ